MAGGIKVLGDLGKLVGECVEHSIILGDNRFSVDTWAKHHKPPP